MFISTARSVCRSRSPQGLVLAADEEMMPDGRPPRGGDDIDEAERRRLRRFALVSSLIGIGLLVVWIGMEMG